MQPLMLLTLNGEKLFGAGILTSDYTHPSVCWYRKAVHLFLGRAKRPHSVCFPF